MCLFCCQTTEEDLNLDSEPTTEDTGEEVTICVLLFGEEGGVEGGNERLKLVVILVKYVCIYIHVYTHTYPYGLCTYYSQYFPRKGGT